MKVFKKLKSNLVFLNNYIEENGYIKTIKKIITLDFNIKDISIYSGDIKLLSYKEFIEADKQSIINRNYWIFPVCAYTHILDGNIRALFEEIKDNVDIKKIILTRDIDINLDGNNIEYIPLKSILGQEYLLQSTFIFIKHSPKVNTIYPLDSKKHKFINLWHGIPIKRIGISSLDLKYEQKMIRIENNKCYSTIASSKIDKMAMASAFYPLTYNDIWVTGLPRHDFILKDEYMLPIDFQKELNQLDTLLDDKKFILYAPTFRNNQKSGYYNFSEEEKNILNSYLNENNVILGIREHMADSSNSYTKALQGDYIIDVGSKYFPNIEILYRKADILITDYSSCFIDFMLTEKPMISFAYDYKNYIEHERGLFYEFEDVFAGEICKTFESLISSMKNIRIDKNYKYKQKIFFKYQDINNSKRVLEKLKEIE